MKKIILLVLALICVFTLFSCDVSSNLQLPSAALNFERDYGSVGYSVYSGAFLDIFEQSGDIIIPSTYKAESNDNDDDDGFFDIDVNIEFNDVYPVTKIADRGFEDHERITSVTIPTSIKCIGSYAFAGCTSLATIKFEGTMAQWIAIEKGYCWNQGVPANKVICSDGTVLLK